MIKKIYYKLPHKIRNLLLNYSKIIVSTESLENQFLNKKYKNVNLTTNERKKIIENINIMMASIPTATNLNLHLYVMDKLFSSSHNFDMNNSVIVEAGAYKGAMSCTLSLAARALGTKLIIYDSFEGLPEIDIDDQVTFYHHIKRKGEYKKGMYKGSYEEVIENIKKFGSYENCILKKGFFENSMKNVSDKIFFLFLDVDLLSSTKDIILNLWKNILNNSYIFTDDAVDLDLNRIWFNDKWWKENLNDKSPGFVGVGCGLPISGNFSSLGYTIKNPDTSIYQNFNH